MAESNLIEAWSGRLNGVASRNERARRSNGKVETGRAFNNAGQFLVQWPPTPSVNNSVMARHWWSMASAESVHEMPSVLLCILDTVVTSPNDYPRSVQSVSWPALR